MKKIVKGMFVVAGVAAGLFTIGAVVNKVTDGAVVDGLSNLKDKVCGGAKAAAETIGEAAESAAETVVETTRDIAADVTGFVEDATI